MNLPEGYMWFFLDTLSLTKFKKGVSDMEHTSPIHEKPHLQRRSDFIGSNPIAEHNDAGILVTRVGDTYHFAVELDVDSVVEVETTRDKERVNVIINELLPKLPEIRDRFGDCLPD